MPVPPPPPPPPPPPLPISGGSGPPPPPPPPFSLASADPSKIKYEEPKGRGALLVDIQKGARLKKVTQISDRSAPQIENSKGPVKEAGGGGGSTGTVRSAASQALGGLFAGGFPVLRPTGQRDNAGNKPAFQPSGNRTAGPRFPDPLFSNSKAGSNNLNSANPPQPAAASEAISNALRAAPSLPYTTSSLSPPTTTSKLLPTVQDSPPPPPLVDRSTKMTSQVPVYPPPLPPPLPFFLPVSQSDIPLRSQETPALPPPPPRPAPPCGFPNRVADFSSSSLPLSGSREPTPSPPPVPPPLFSRRPILLPPTSTTISSTLHGNNVPPALPPKSPMYPFQASKLSIQSMPLPPTPPFSQATAVQKRMQTKSAVSAGGKQIPPPIPPARSPATELSSKHQPSQVLDWAPSYHSHPIFKNANSQIMDEFESKFAFHSVDEFPPPDEYKPFPRIYPSKIARANGRDLLSRTQMR
uniref:WAS/WASL-interacting protein family member 3 isoform X2 n=1 Tax=Geotrypetes seraphini TaxID=260995 RepID=A0A6P8QIT2_GEOSA|nr:WAS/WASL-interacting protein family member 3 isoform X2 [Geotrypetes seraphini]XP_033786636.1 WAS/WASL-interacting protein family member 3 isoform X2 [Geotrypetes seraphini]XP_033786637.1 WAS/WASL-interacting protein family member 3 isoform X2 [Geotrypetes seraphini]XP_033786638.1 WAS/WASL-interacting protein family member 3 isoform X2 [Geotrypetes seraphini]